MQQNYVKPENMLRCIFQVRGVQFSKELVKLFNFHRFDNLVTKQLKVSFFKSTATYIQNYVVVIYLNCKHIDEAKTFIFVTILD